MSYSSSSVSTGASGDDRASPQVRINRCCPPPEHWTKVKELNVENREPCEVETHTCRKFALQAQNTIIQIINILSDLEKWSWPSTFQAEGAHGQLSSFAMQLLMVVMYVLQTACEHVIHHLDKSVAASMTSRSKTTSPTTTTKPTNTNTVGTQTD